MIETTMFITNNPKIAVLAENAGINWIFVDLEVNGKEVRQKNLDSVISYHSISDVVKIKNVLHKSKLLVRINPLNENSDKEIDDVIKYGANIIMLPYFKTSYEVDKFIKMVDGRCETCLLLETPEAVDNINAICSLKGINYIHIGLNDLHLGYRKNFMFELLADGTVEKICNEIAKYSITYGIGGIGRVGTGELPADLIISEHLRLGSKMVILSRSFCNTKKTNDLSIISNELLFGMNEFHKYQTNLNQLGFHVLYENQEKLKATVESIVQRIRGENFNAE